MNPIVKSIFAWMSETVLASVLELLLVTLINVWNCTVVHFDLFLPQIDIAKLCKVTNCKDASTSYEPFQTPTTDDLILLDFGSTIDEYENCQQSDLIGVEGEKEDCAGVTEFKMEAENNRPLKLPNENGAHKGFKKNKYVTEDLTKPDESYYYDLNNFGVQETTQLNDEFVVQKMPFARLHSNEVESGMTTERLDSLGFISPLKYPNSRNLPFNYTDCRENQTNMYVVKEKSVNQLNDEFKCDPNTLMNSSGVRKNVEAALDIMEINTKEGRRLSIEEISSADWGQTLKYHSKTKSDNKKPIKKQHALNPLTISPVKSFERKMSDTVAVNTFRNRSEDLSIKEFLSLGKVSLNGWQERNQTVKQKSIEENMFRSQPNIPSVSCKKDIISCRQKLVGNSNVVNENNNRVNGFNNGKNKYVSLDEPSNDMLFSSKIDKNSEVHTQSSQLHNSTRIMDEMKDTALIQDSLMKETTSPYSYLESTIAKHKIMDTTVMYNKIHNTVNWNPNFKPREALGSYAKLHNLSRYNGQSENQKIANDLNLRNKFESWMVVQNENDILEVNENENVSQKEHNILGNNSYLENKNVEFQSIVLDPLSPLTENHEEDFGGAYLTYKTTSVLQGEQLGEEQSDGTVVCTDNIQTGSIQGTKKVQFKPEVETFIYEPEYSTMETFLGPEDFRIEHPVNTRSGSLSRSFPIPNCCDSMLSKDNYREDWVNYDHKFINIIRDHPRIPEVISEDCLEDITDVSEKELKFLQRLKRDRKIFRRKKDPYVRSEGEVPSITHHFQSLKLDPKPLFEKLKKKVFGK